MRRKSSGIINVAFDATGRLLIIYSAFAKYLIKNGNKMKKFIITIDFKKAYDPVRREAYIRFSLSLISLGNL